MNEKSMSVIENLPKSQQPFLTPKLLDTIYQSFYQCQEKWLKDDIVLNSSNMIDHQKLNTESNKTIQSYEPSMSKSIVNKPFYEQIFHLEIGTNKYNITFYHPKHNIPKSQVQNYFSDCCMKIYVWLCYVQPFIRKNCSKKMDIFIWFSNEKKQMIQNEKHFTTKHANSAFTTSCKIETSIYIYRKEEWFKVFLHETFHSLGLDFSTIMNDPYEQHIISLFPVKSTQGIRLYESYCEFWGEIYNILFVAFFQSTTKHDFKHLTKELYVDELQFSAFQVVKILKHYDSSLNYETFIKHETPVIVESTSVLSYYIVKFVLLFYCRDFESWCVEHNGSAFLQFQTKHLPSFYEFISSKYNSLKLIEYLREIESNFSKLKLNLELRKTMRMTLNEI